MSYFSFAPKAAPEVSSLTAVPVRAAAAPANFRVPPAVVLIADENLAADGRLACVFPSVAEAVLANHTALVEGQVFGPFGPVITDISPLEWLLCLAPRPFAPSFAVCNGTDPPTQFVWLVPISSGEAAEVGQGNLSGLVRRWVEGKVDLMDWRRGV